ISPDGSVSLVLGPPELSAPSGLAADGAGQLFIADSHNHRVWRVDGEGRLSTVAGTGLAGWSGDGGPAGLAPPDEPWGLALDSTGHLYLADAANHRVRRVTPAGITSTAAGAGVPGFTGDGGPAALARLDRPLDLTVDRERNLFIVDSLNNRVRKVGRDG